MILNFSVVMRFDVESFLAKRARKYSRNSLSGMRVSLGRVISWAGQCDWLEKNPCSGLELPHAGEHRADDSQANTSIGRPWYSRWSEKPRGLSIRLAARRQNCLTRIGIAKRNLVIPSIDSNGNGVTSVTSALLDRENFARRRPRDRATFHADALGISRRLDGLR
jgi:hypothetical protein